MRSVQVTRFGGPEVLEVRPAPDPVAGPGHVLLRVAVVDVLFLETQLRSGWGTEFFEQAPPYVPGGGAAGRVISVGEGVDPGWVGTDVVAMTDGGAYAELATAPAGSLIPVPDGLPPREAAALLQIGPAALSLVDGADLRPGRQVLVTAAGGGLGGLLVQLARTAGARVIAAARGARKLAVARELGAAATVDYSEPGWPARVRAATGDRGPDVVFDGVGGDIGTAAFEITAPGGRFFAYGVPSGSFAAIDAGEAERRAVNVTGIERVQFAPAELRKLAERALGLAAAGEIRPIIGRTFPLERAGEAHAAIEAREVIGKTLLLVNEEGGTT